MHMPKKVPQICVWYMVKHKDVLPSNNPWKNCCWLPRTIPSYLQIDLLMGGPTRFFLAWALIFDPKLGKAQSFMGKHRFRGGLAVQGFRPKLARSLNRSTYLHTHLTCPWPPAFNLIPDVLHDRLSVLLQNNFPFDMLHNSVQDLIQQRLNFIAHPHLSEHNKKQSLYQQTLFDHLFVKDFSLSNLLSERAKFEESK